MNPIDNPLPARRNPLNRVVGLLFGLFAVMALVLCVGTALIQRQFTSSIRTRDPAEVRRISALIANVTLPPEFQPFDALESNQFGAQTRIAVWKNKHDGFLFLASLPQDFDLVSITSVQDEVTKFLMFDLPLHDVPAYHGSVTSAAERIQVQGRTIDFTITEPTVMPHSPALYPGGTLSEISAHFPTKDGKNGLFLLRCPSAEIKHEQLLDIAKSVR